MLLPLLQNNLLTGAGGGVVASLNATEAGDTVAALMAVAVGASANIGEASDTGAAQAAVLLGATGSPVELGDTAAASGSVGSSAVNGALAATEDGDVAAGFAEVTGGTPEADKVLGAMGLGGGGYRPPRYSTPGTQDRIEVPISAHAEEDEEEIVLAVLMRIAHMEYFA